MDRFCLLCRRRPSMSPPRPRPPPPKEVARPAPPTKRTTKPKAPAVPGGVARVWLLNQPTDKVLLSLAVHGNGAHPHSPDPLTHFFFCVPPDTMLPPTPLTSILPQNVSPLSNSVSPYPRVFIPPSQRAFSFAHFRPFPPPYIALIPFGLQHGADSFPTLSCHLKAGHGSPEGDDGVEVPSGRRQ